MRVPSGASGRYQNTFYECLIPAALIEHLRDMFELAGIPFCTVRYFNLLPAEGRKQFTLALAEITYQVWIARCCAAYSPKTPDLHEVRNKVRKEL